MTSPTMGSGPEGLSTEDQRRVDLIAEKITEYLESRPEGDATSKAKIDQHLTGIPRIDDAVVSQVAAWIGESIARSMGNNPTSERITEVTARHLTDNPRIDAEVLHAV